MYERISKLTIEDITNNIDTLNNKITKNYDSLIKKIDTKIEKLIDLYSDGLIDKEKLTVRMNSLNKEKEELIEEEASLSEEVNTEAIQLIKDKKLDIYNMPNDEKKAVIDILVNQIVFYEDRFDIIWNF